MFCNPCLNVSSGKDDVIVIRRHVDSMLIDQLWEHVVFVDDDDDDDDDDGCCYCCLQITTMYASKESLSDILGIIFKLSAIIVVIVLHYPGR